MTDYLDIETLKRANQKTGGHWFSRDTMRFFASRLPAGAYCGDGVNAYFVTSERCTFTGSGRSHPRLYTVRVCDMETGEVDTIGEFQAYRSRSGADRRARWLADNPDEPTKHHQLREARKLADDEIRRHAWIATANGSFDYRDTSFTTICELVRRERKLPPLHGEAA